MLRAECVIAVALAAGALVLGCEDEDAPLGSDRDPMAEVSLWPVPRPAGPPVIVAPGMGGAGGGAGAAAATFDPDAVYLVGTIGDVCISRAIMDVEAPDRLLAGIDCSAKEHTAAIRADDGRLVYVDGEHVRAFRCGGCAYTRADVRFFPTHLGGADNVAALNCSSVNDLIVGAHGELAFKCSSTWLLLRDLLQGFFGDLGPELFALGPAGSALSETHITRGDRSSVPLMLPAGRRLRVARARAEGYRAVFERPGAAPELHEIALDGSAVHVGTYPEAPSDADPTERLSVALDGAGRLLELLTDGRILRRSVAGATEIIYEASMAPHFAPGALVTGP